MTRIHTVGTGRWERPPSLKYGVPYPVVARMAFGVTGANLAAVVRGIVGIVWYGVQILRPAGQFHRLRHHHRDRHRGHLKVFGEAAMDPVRIVERIGNP